VVAVGASAGGLAAFTALLKALPAKSGMAFVLIQHLEPKHESALTGLLSKATTMPVVEVSDGIAVEPNHVYVIPPNKSVTIRKGTLRLTPRSEGSKPQHPIDDFAAALAEEQGNAAIGVVLSGTGSDGTNGLKAIKAAGGVTFAQAAKTAEWPAMPLSAIAAGSVDFVLAPKLIAVELARIGRHPYLAGAREVPEGSELDKLCQVLRSAVGVDFRLYKQATVRRRIARRMALLKIPSLTKYAHMLSQNPEEAQALADELFIHVTSFFRDAECFQVLRKRVLAKLRAKRAAGDPIRIWVAGCSTGEEAYSISMLLLEELGEAADRIKIQIFGTDIQARAVEQARAGTYTEAAVSGVSPARLKRFFIKVDHGYQIQQFVRDLCVFARHDLAKDPPFSRLDLISCRNVLIYMGPELQERTLSIFQYALKPGGFLFLGNSESISGYPGAFTAIDQKHRIYLRKAPTAGFHDSPSTGKYANEPYAIPPRASAPSPGADFRMEAEGILLADYAPAALVVDSDLHIVHFQGDTSPYLAPATGQASFHLLKIVRPEFVVHLRTAIQQARRKGGPVRQEGVRFERDGKPATVRLEVRTLKKHDGKKANLLVVFQDVETLTLEEPGKHERVAKGKKHTAEKTARMERELASAHEQLRALISEQETVQAEMRAANEEVLSSSEELQSTNEELETAKEELQSSNEELLTLNEELQHRNNELGVLGHDLNNLLVGVDIPVLVLDANLCVRRFTPVAGSLLNLIAGDVGRPFSDIASGLDVDDWETLFPEVLQQGRRIEREVRDRNGHWYSLRVRPYKTTANEIEGALLVLLDIDVIKRTVANAEEARSVAAEAQLRNESILNSLSAQVAVLGPDGTIQATNEAWDRFARANGNPPMTAVGPGVDYLDVCRKAISSQASEAQAALDGIQGVLEGHLESYRLEYPCHSPNEERWFVMLVTPLKGTKGGAVLTHINVTERKRLEEKLRRQEQEVSTLLDSTPDLIMRLDRQFRYTYVNAKTAQVGGIPREAFIGKTPEEMGLPPELIELWEPAIRRIFEKGQPNSVEFSYLSPDGPTEWEERFIPEFAADGSVEALLVIGRDVTEQKRLEKVAAANRDEIRALAAGLMRAQEEERRRVSRELHDQICQQLASLAIDMSRLAADPALKDAKSRLKALQARAVKASEETRHIAYQLHPSILDDLGLVASLKSLCKEFSMANDIAMECINAALPASVPLAVASCLYRVAQESLNNVAKHSKAKHVSVALSKPDGAIVLTISDDGVGFDRDTVKGRGGLGLITMEERVRLVNGKLSIETRPDRGSRVEVEIPLGDERL